MASAPEDETAVSTGFLGLTISNPPSPPPPAISSEGIVTLDITQKFISAAATLEAGELVKDGYFTLFESVGALEIMDPKMDSGCLAPGESLDEDYDVTRLLHPSEVLGIIDQLLSLEIAWHLGYPLSQTLFTSVYIERMLMPDPPTIHEADFVRGQLPDTPRDPMLRILRAYCLGLLKACWYVNERIKCEHYYEEEDFVTNTYHRTLLENIDRDEIRDEIMAARRTLHDRRLAITDDMAQALGLRLELRTAFLRAIELTELRSNPDSLSLPWFQLQSVWEAINKTRHLGSPVPEAFSTKIQRRLASTMPPRPIVQPSPEETHAHFKKLFADGIDVLNVLRYSDSQSLLNFVLAFQAQKPQPLVYIRTLLQSFLFQDMVILGRLSIRQVLDDDLSIVVLPGSILIDPALDAIEAPQSRFYAIAHHMEVFRQRAAQSYLDIFRAFCQNRCRVRRTLFHSIRDWETVQLDAEEIDRLLQAQLDEVPQNYNGVPSYALPLSSWAYHYKLRLMCWTVQLGFELEIYQPDELAGMYWYLGYLSEARAQHAQRTAFFAAESESVFNSAAAAAATAIIPGGTNPSAFPSPAWQRRRDQRRSKAYQRLTALEATATAELAGALSRLYTALRRLGLLPLTAGSRARPYSTDAMRYRARMRPFASVSLPPLPPFESFERATARPETPTPALLDEAGRAAAAARRALEKILPGGNNNSSSSGTSGGNRSGNNSSEEDVFAVGSYDRWVAERTGWMRSVIAAGVAVETAKRAAARQGEGGDGELGLSVEVPKPEEGYHEWWIVPRIVEKK